MQEKFNASFDSLYNYAVPEWFQDAKFGIWSHWGAQSVPMYGDWYARNMYVEESPQYLYHIRHYGHPSKFGYKDLVKLWKAEKFSEESADELMGLYVKAGAHYFMGQAMHHDHFFNFPSRYNRFNSVEIGPHKNISGIWKGAADNHHLPFGLSEHLGASFTWWAVNKGHDRYGPYKDIPYDGNNKEYEDFYFNNYQHIIPEGDTRWIDGWYTPNEEYHQLWLAVIKEIIDTFKPELLYTDGGLPFGYVIESGKPEYSAGVDDPRYHYGLEAVSYLYNTSIGKHGENQAVYLQKDRRKEIYSVGVLDIEKSQLPGVQERSWHTDTCIGNWFYDVRQDYKKPGHIIEMLIDIVSKNGNMLLNILQRPDGSIDDQAHFILDEIASWMPVCGEGIFGTRPWRVDGHDRYGEGRSGVLIEGFKEEQVPWQDTDYRFTTKQEKDGGLTVYAFMMKAPENRVAVIRSFEPREKVRSVKLLDGKAGIPVEWSQNFGALTVKLPETLPTQYTNCLAIVY
ncbi:MAG: alpha-L-fucosidase [Spirochaetaceae bacterium]|jgi:alpha-L-fucosidase|nr:alpha-L-fucosidase [Spirochaetaceae bacterium]